MLREGTADPVIDPEDVIRHFGADIEYPEETGKTSGQPAEMNEEEETIYQLLLEDSRSIDELAADTGIPLGLLHSNLLSLQMKKRIQRLPGSMYGSL